MSFDVALDETSTYYVADHIVVQPDWLTGAPCVGSAAAVDARWVASRSAVGGAQPGDGPEVRGGGDGNADSEHTGAP